MLIAIELVETSLFASAIPNDDDDDDDDGDEDDDNDENSIDK